MVSLKTEQNILEAVKALGAKRPLPNRYNAWFKSYYYRLFETIDDIEKYSEAGSFRRYKEMSK